MRLLDRYLLRELLLPFGYCLGGFTVVWVSAELLGRLDDFKEKGMSAAQIAAQFAWGMPETFALLVPIALLLAVLYALTNHSRHNELTAIRAAGISLWRLSLPYLGLGVVASLLLMASNEWLQPHAARRLADQATKGPKSTAVPLQGDMVFKNALDGRVWKAESFRVDSGEMIRPFVIWRMANGARRELYAQRATFAAGAWTFEGVQDITYASNEDPIPLANLRTNRLVFPGWRETPDSIRLQLKIADLSSVRAAKGAQLSLGEIREYLALNQDLVAAKVGMLRTQFHARLAEPWRCLVVVLVAIPFGSMGGRRGKFVGVASSIFIVFGYFLVMRFCLALGTGGYLAPALAAWAPNALFMGAGALLIWRAR